VQFPDLLGGHVLLLPAQEGEPLSHQRRVLAESIVWAVCRPIGQPV
jgi:hypothetical protein